MGPLNVASSLDYTCVYRFYIHYSTIKKYFSFCCCFFFLFFFFLFCFFFVFGLIFVLFFINIMLSR